MFCIKRKAKPTISSMKVEFGFETLTQDEVDYPVSPESIIFSGRVYNYIDYTYSYGSSHDVRKMLLKYSDDVHNKRIHLRFTTFSNGSLFGAWILFIDANKTVI
jgi:hypothetical protein